VLGLVMAGLVVVRLQGVGSALAWGLVLLGLLAVVPLVRVERELAEPLIDVRLLASPGQWPIQLTAFLFGMSVLGAQIPLSTFARTDPAQTGYGLGADAGFVSTLIGLYVVALLVGALLLPVAARVLGPRGALVRRVRARGRRLRALAALPRHHGPGPAQHGRRRPRIGPAGGGASCSGGRSSARRPHRFRHRHDQRDEDRRRRDRLCRLRDIAGLHRKHRRPDRGGRLARGLL
jgi:hypothetical protein